MSGADAQSPETSFSGLPKACKLVNTAGQVAPALATFTTMLFDNPVKFNYGPFAFGLSGAAFTSIIIQEPGVYEFLSSIGYNSTGQQASSWLFQNGGLTWRDGSIAQFFTGAGLGSAVYIASQQCHQVAECLAGDVISLIQDQTTAALATAAGYTWLYAEKKGGQY